jgi:hypothetical protein
VLVAGDSFAPWLYNSLGERGKREGLTATELDYKNSSGLALNSFFDWPARLRELMAAASPPEAVVVFLGANDDKVMQAGGKKIEQLTPAWREEYTRRAGAVMDTVGQRGARLYWVGMPVMRDKWRRDNAAALNDSVRAAAADRPWVHFVDTWAMFADADGDFTTAKPDANGTMTVVRQEDGVHLTRVGTDWVAARVYAQMLADWGAGAG